MKNSEIMKRREQLVAIIRTAGKINTEDAAVMFGVSAYQRRPSGRISSTFQTRELLRRYTEEPYCVKMITSSLFQSGKP